VPPPRRRISPNVAVTVALLGTEAVSARLLQKFGSAARNSLPAVSHMESRAASFIRARIGKGTVVHADGITFMSISRLRGLVIGRRTASTACALT
jgi:hypothetical protein